MAELGLFTVERVEGLVEIKIIPIPDSLGDEDGDREVTGIAFSRKAALRFAWIIVRVTIGRVKANECDGKGRGEA